MKMEDFAQTLKVTLLSEEISTSFKNGKAELHIKLEMKKEKNARLKKEEEKSKLGPFQKASKTELNAENHEGL